MPKALADICQYAGEEFASAHIEHSRIKAECRADSACCQLSAAQSDSVEVFKGAQAQAFDDNGNPTKRLRVCPQQGVSAADLKVKRSAERYVVAEKIEKGQATSLSFLRYWTGSSGVFRSEEHVLGDPSVRFARPVRWIVALYGGSVIKVGFGNVESGNVSRGHRFMGAGSVVINDPSEYKRLMKENFVITDPEERKEMILAGIASVEKELGAKVEVDPDLLEENVHLNEYPVVFYGSFDKEFLEIPEEVLVLSMAKSEVLPCKG